MINELSQTAACHAVHGIEHAISKLEVGIMTSSELVRSSKLEDSAKAYFSGEMKRNAQAIENLRRLKSLLHRRASDAYFEERSGKAEALSGEGREWHRSAFEVASRNLSPSKDEE